MHRRRDFIAGLMFAAATGRAQAQQTGKVYRIAFAHPKDRTMAETRKLAAILAADVAGYSKLAGADEERTLARLRALWSDLIAPTIALLLSGATTLQHSSKQRKRRQQLRLSAVRLPQRHISPGHQRSLPSASWNPNRR